MLRFLVVVHLCFVLSCASVDSGAGTTGDRVIALQISPTDELVAEAFSDGMFWHQYSWQQLPLATRIEGTVSSVDGKRVLIDLGEVPLPHEFMFAMVIFSGGTYKGQVVVLRRVTSILVCYLTDAVDGVEISVGDSATSHL